MTEIVIDMRLQIMNAWICERKKCENRLINKLMNSNSCFLLFLNFEKKCYILRSIIRKGQPYIAQTCASITW